MTHLSKNIPRKKTQLFLSNLLSGAISNLKPNEVFLLEDLVISKTESEMIKKRLGILWLLQNGADQTQISNLLKVTKQTVSRVYMSWRIAPKEVKSLIAKKINVVKKGFTAKDVLKSILDADISVRSQLRRLHRI